MKTHYAPSGEWGSTKVCEGRYFSSDVKLAENKEKVTCKHCLRNL